MRGIVSPNATFGGFSVFRGSKVDFDGVKKGAEMEVLPEEYFRRRGGRWNADGRRKECWGMKDVVLNVGKGCCCGRQHSRHIRSPPVQNRLRKLNLTARADGFVPLFARCFIGCRNGLW